MHCGIEIQKPKRKFCSSAHKNLYNQKHIYNYKYNKEYRGRTKENYLSHLLSYKKRRLTISLNDLVNLWDKQEGRCALSGIELTHTQNSGKSITNASIDRIDSTKGYELDNIQLVCAIVNVMKNNFNQNEFLNFCRKVVLYNERWEPEE